jgi:hypothetical protein
MRITTIAVVVACASCAHTTDTVVLDNRGYAELIQDAEEHDRIADHLEQQAETTEGGLGDDRYDCGDPVLHEQSTSGTEPVSYWNPCYDITGPAADRQRDEASKHRAQARRDRASASALARSRTL